jgi:predicted ArsR family transcriptional regulator
MAPLAPLSEQLLSVVSDHVRVTIRDAVALLGANRNTIKLHLKQLVRVGHLVQRGRGTWYERL